MKIAIGSDHAGFSLKEHLVEFLRKEGHEVTNVGTFGPESTDYPDYAAAVAGKVATGEVERGVLVCYTGVGMSIAANKVPGVRAALAFNPDEIQLTRAHNNSNVIAFGAKYIAPGDAEEMTRVFLATPYEGGRHERRVSKIAAIEKAYEKGPESKQE
jgi:ribose 5-phosphate isomerase B